MSYSPIRNDDSLSELISRINDLVVVFDNHLMKSLDQPEAFELWLEKCAEISKPALRRKLLENREKINDSLWKRCSEVIANLNEKGDRKEYLDPQ